MNAWRLSVTHSPYTELVLQRILDIITSNSTNVLDHKLISHYCAESMDSPFSRRVLFNSALVSGDPERCMFAMKKLQDSNEKLLSSLLSDRAKLKPNKKSWHEKWISDAALHPDLSDAHLATMVFVIGDSEFLQAERMKASGLEQWVYLDDGMPIDNMFCRIVQSLEGAETNIVAGGIVFTSLETYEKDKNQWDSMSSLLGIKTIRVTEAGQFHAGDGAESCIFSDLSEVIVYALLQRFFCLAELSMNRHVIFESIFSKCPIRPLNVSFAELLGSEFLKNFQPHGKEDEKQLLVYAKTLNNVGLHAACIDLLDIVGRDSWSKFTHKWYINSLFNLADFQGVVELCNELPHLSKLSRLQFSESQAVLEMKHLLESYPETSAQPGNIFSRKSMVSVLHACPPFQSGGYVNRAHGILKSLGTLGWEITGVARPGFPDVVVEHGNVHVYDGVRYLTSGSSRRRQEGEYQYMQSTIDYYASVFKEIKPSIVHLRSTYVSALPALIAARLLKIPTLYEVSGMWELVYAFKTDSVFVGKYNRTIMLENIVYNNVNKIVTSTNFMKEIIESRKDNETRVDIVPNAVDAETFQPSAKDFTLLEEFKWEKDSIVFGYLGSFVDYEGLELLVDAFADLHRVIPKVKLLLVGDGAVMSSIRMKVVRSGLTSAVKLTGRVPHQQIPRYYSIVDVTPFPRLDTPATRAVAPLKPFEAMASGKSVVVSDLDALTEIVNDGEYGWIFRAGSKASLTEALRTALESSHLKREKSMSWVRENRTWTNVGRKIDEVIAEI